ncbi:hypothetical protein ACFFGR_10705 [Arthrobacter liuii]|uniref:hypothetical protein n=1 Tax=Arthrobacter liuii TaxID=1476996 RepID=UPI001663775D|nr:hypothetical protein [Arthrobacter liuii]
MDETGRALVTAVLPPLVTAVLAALSLWSSELRRERNAAQRRRQAIAEETNHVRYLKAWLETELLAGGSKGGEASKVRAEVRKQLVASHARLSSVGMKKTEARPPVMLRALKTAALVPLSRPAARVVRGVYWFVLVLGICVWSFVITRDFTEVRTINVGVSDHFFFSLMVLLQFLSVAVLLAHWARALESGRDLRASDPSIGALSPNASGSGAGAHEARLAFGIGLTAPHRRRLSSDPGRSER